MEFKLSSYELEMLMDKVNNIIFDFDIESIKNEYKELIEKESHLFTKLMEIQDVKNNVEFIYSYMKLTNNKKIYFNNEYHYQEDFEDYLIDLRSFEMQLQKEYSNIGYSDSLPKKILRTNQKREYTKEEREQKQTLQLVLKKSENYLFPKNDLAIGRAIEELTKFSKKTVIGDINEGKVFSLKIYDNAIKKLEIILSDINKEKNKLHPDN